MKLSRVTPSGLTFLRWWIFTILTAVAVLYVGSIGLFQSLWYSDQTKLSFVIITLYTFVSVYIGINSYPERSPNEKGVKVCWFTTEVMTALGMLGTVAGFLLMLGPAFASIDINNTAKMTTAITQMASGMSTALTTTLVGLICSLLTAIQLVNLRYGKSEL